jgi:hypothetical protein
MDPRKMTYEQFLPWATQHVLTGLGRGDRLHDLIHGILKDAFHNRLFGIESRPTKIDEIRR